MVVEPIMMTLAGVSLQKKSPNLNIYMQENEQNNQKKKPPSKKLIKEV